MIIFELYLGQIQICHLSLLKNFFLFEKSLGAPNLSRKKSIFLLSELIVSILFSTPMWYSNSQYIVEDTVSRPLPPKKKCTAEIIVCLVNEKLTLNTWLNFYSQENFYSQNSFICLPSWPVSTVIHSPFDKYLLSIKNRNKEK